MAAFLASIKIYSSENFKEDMTPLSRVHGAFQSHTKLLSQYLLIALTATVQVIKSTE
jgi:hypothetical protein